MAALSTTGYGDIKQITPLGKFLGAIITISGIGMFAVLAGIIATGFINKIQSGDKKRISVLIVVKLLIKIKIKI